MLWGLALFVNIFALFIYKKIIFLMDKCKNILTNKKNPGEAQSMLEIYERDPDGETKTKERGT